MTASARILSGFLWVGALTAGGQPDFFEQAPIAYSATSPRDPVSQLKGELESLPYVADGKETLRAVLRILDVPIASQVLVFSKTSFQNRLIRPETPRALYFSDRFYVGWVPHGDIEIISFDPALGPIFYLLSLPGEAGRGGPVVERTRQCLDCHAGARTDYVPGMVVRSVFPQADGFPILSAGTFTIDDTRPLQERWGGWFVTGQSDGPRHMGNRLYRETASGGAETERDFGVALTTLGGVFDTTLYLHDGSDVVSLLVLEHQVRVHNALTQARLAFRRQLYRNREMAEILGTPPDVWSETTTQVIHRQTDRLVDALLFRNEFPLPGWGVEGGEAFRLAFAAGARRSQSGASLRDFQLLSRIFKHRCSYMIHSEAFTSLPDQLRDLVLQRLSDILSGRDTESTHGDLSAGERVRIARILEDTGVLRSDREDGRNARVDPVPAGLPR